MAKWQFTKAGVPTGENFDDGHQEKPGDDAFTNAQALVAAEAAGADGLNYTGPSDLE